MSDLAAPHPGTIGAKAVTRRAAQPDPSLTDTPAEEALELRWPATTRAGAVPDDTIGGSPPKPDLDVSLGYLPEVVLMRIPEEYPRLILSLRRANHEAPESSVAPVDVGTGRPR